MLDFLGKLIKGGEAEPADEGEKLRLAATALLFRALFVDGEAHDSEEMQIRRIVRDEFGLDADEVGQLMGDARYAAENAADLYGWTRVVNAEYTPDEKVHLMELLWRVVLADGVVDDHEHALMRRLAGLIHVPDGDSARARARAREALG